MRNFGLNKSPLTRTQKARAATRQAILSFLEETGWEADKYGNYKKLITGTPHRYNFKDNVLCYEVKSGDRWMRLRSGYWKDLTIVNGVIKGWK